jgi:hypothetical protein
MIFGMNSRFWVSLSFAATYERWPLLCQTSVPPHNCPWPLHGFSIILKFASYLLLEPDEIWELVGPHFPTKKLPRPIITGNSLKVTTLKQFFFFVLHHAIRTLSWTSEQRGKWPRFPCILLLQKNRTNVMWNQASRAQKQTLCVLYNAKTLTKLGYFS